MRLPTSRSPVPPSNSGIANMPSTGMNQCRSRPHARQRQRKVDAPEAAPWPAPGSWAASNTGSCFSRWCRAGRMTKGRVHVDRTGDHRPANSRLKGPGSMIRANPDQEVAGEGQDHQQHQEVPPRGCGRWLGGRADGGSRQGSSSRSRRGKDAQDLRGIRVTEEGDEASRVTSAVGPPGQPPSRRTRQPEQRAATMISEAGGRTPKGAGGSPTRRTGAFAARGVRHRTLRRRRPGEVRPPRRPRRARPRGGGRQPSALTPLSSTRQTPPRCKWWRPRAKGRFVHSPARRPASPPGVPGAETIRAPTANRAQLGCAGAAISSHGGGQHRRQSRQGPSTTAASIRLMVPMKSDRSGAWRSVEVHSGGSSICSTARRS